MLLRCSWSSYRIVKRLGVDYGKSRTGLAVSDCAGVTCRPLEVLTEKDGDRLIQAIMAAAKTHSVEEIVVGVPRPLSGGTNAQMRDVLSFVDRLRKESQIDVVTWDERFTSVLAERGDKKRGARDSVAACYMLQNYLDRLSADDRGPV